MIEPLFRDQKLELTVFMHPLPHGDSKWACHKQQATQIDAPVPPPPTNNKQETNLTGPPPHLKENATRDLWKASRIVIITTVICVTMLVMILVTID